MKKHRQKSMSVQLLKERMKLQSEENKEESKTVDLSKINKRSEMEKRNVVMLNPSEYKKHKKAKDILVGTVGLTSDLLFKSKITKEEFDKMQIEGAKKAIRSTNLFIATRAWNEVVNRLLEIPGMKKNGVPIRFQPMTDFMARFGCIKMIVEDNESIKSEKEIDSELDGLKSDKQDKKEEIHNEVDNTD